MTNKEELDQLYNKLNNGLLIKNYYTLTKSTGDLAEGLALQYVSLVDTIRDRELLFAKRLTKVASHRLKEHPDSVLEKLFSFNMEGAEMCGLRDYSEESITENNRIVIRGHFFSHAGTEAYYLHKRQNYNLGWARKSYEASFKAALSLHNLRPLESASSSFFAAETAYRLYFATNNSIWSKRAKKAYNSFLDISLGNPGDFEDDLIKRANNALRHIRKRRQGNRENGGRNGRYNRKRRVDKRERNIDLD